MSHDVRLRGCTCVHCTGYGASAVYSSCVVSCPFCVWRAARRHDWRKPVASQSHTPHCFLSSWRARAEKVPSTSALLLSHSLGSRRPGVPLPSRASPRLLSLQMVTRPPNGGQKHASLLSLQVETRPPNGGQKHASLLSLQMETRPPSGSV